MQGADGAAVSSFSYGETDSDGLPITVPAGTTVQTALGGSLTVNADGSWNYVPPASVDNSGAVTETIGYTVTDGDGDTAFGTQEITITDDAMTVTTSSEAATVSESALDSGSAPDAAGRSATGSFADNFDFGADGAGVITGVSFNGSNFGPDSTGTITIADAAWQLQVNADGSYSFTLLDGVSHGGRHSGFRVEVVRDSLQAVKGLSNFTDGIFQVFRGFLAHSNFLFDNMYVVLTIKLSIRKSLVTVSASRCRWRRPCGIAVAKA